MAGEIYGQGKCMGNVPAMGYGLLNEWGRFCGQKRCIGEGVMGYMVLSRGEKFDL